MIEQVKQTYSDEPTDYLQDLIKTMLGRTRGTTMPPSPGVKHIDVNAYLYNTTVTAKTHVGVAMHYDMRVEWRGFMPWLFKSLKPYQILDRSRVGTFAAPILEANEMYYRIDAVHERIAQQTYESVKLTDSESESLISMVLEETIKFMKIDPIWIRHYINEHTHSSLGKMHSWQEAYDLEPAEIKQIFDIHKGNLEYLLQHPFKWTNTRYNLGIRARSNELTSTAMQTKFEGDLERSRIVLFQPSQSTLTLFIPNKAAWYTTILNKAITEHHIVGKWIWPYVEGGGVYLIARQLFSDRRGDFRAYDGKNWEASVGLILGKGFNAFMSYAGKIPILPSGITFTSMFGTLAMMIAMRDFDSNGTYISLGDDLNYFGKKAIPYTFVEHQEIDTRDLYLLGVSSREDVEAPRVIGIKVQSDRSKLTSPLPIKGIGKQFSSPHPLDRPLDQRIRVAWAGLYHGWFGDRTLIQAISKTPPGEFVSPGELIEGHLEDEYTKVNAFGWSEAYGVASLFKEED